MPWRTPAVLTRISCPTCAGRGLTSGGAGRSISSSARSRAGTEPEWLACDDFDAMLRFAAKRFSLRKRRLFACACCRLVWRELTPGCEHVVGLAEGVADGRVT